MLPRKKLLRSCRTGPHCVAPVLSLLASIAILISGISCGGGGGNGAGGGGGGSTPSFSLALSTASLTVASGGTQTVTVTLQPQGGFSGTVSVTFSGLPAGVTASPASLTLAGSGSQQVQLGAAASATAGTYPVTVSGSSGSLSASAQLQLTVAAPSLSLTLQPTSLSLIPGIAQQVTVSVTAANGFNQLVSGTVSNLPAGVTVNSTTFSTFPGGTSTLTFTAAAGASSGTVQLSAGSGSLTAAAQLPISINTTPDFQLSTHSNPAILVSQGASTTLPIFADSLNGFNQPVSVSFSGVPAGVTFSPATFTLQPGGAPQTVTISASFSATPANPEYVTIVGTSGSLTHQLQVVTGITAAALSLTLQPHTLTVPAGSTNDFQVQLINVATGKPSGNIAVTITGAPAGVTVSPTSYTAPPQGVLFDVYVQAASNATAGTITVTATYGPATAQSSVSIAVGAADSFTSVPLSTADQLVHVDTIWPYYSFPPSNYTVYHAPTQRFFSSEPLLNRLYVVDATTRKLAATLSIPGPLGLDQAPDGSVLYVGTTMGDLYVVDPVNLTILKRYPSSTISPYGFPANAVYALADGKLILETYFLVPGYSWVDGNGPIALWDPQTNNITIFSTPSLGQGGVLPQAPSCVDRFEQVLLTNNRTRVMLAPVYTSQGSSMLCSLDPESDTWNWSPVISGGSGSAFVAFAASSDGNTLVTFDGYNIYVLDPATFAIRNTIKIPPGQTGYAPMPFLMLSADNSSVFMTDPNGADVLDEYNLTTGQMTGWIPQVSLASPDSYTPVSPFYQGITSSGLAAGVIPGGGVGLLDTTAVHAPPIGSRFTQTELQIPYGPVNGGTMTSWFPSSVGEQPPPLGSIYFGANAATDINNNGFAGFLEAVSPPGNPGPVDVRTLAADGGSQFIPDGFSYGPWVNESMTTYSTAEGGGLGDLFGYGFGPLLYNAGSLFIAPPSDLQVTVGGTAAKATGFSPNAYGSTYFTEPIFPSEAVQFTIPPGSPGAAETIAVSNSAGSTTATQTINYLPAVQQYSVAGQLADGVYDPVRDVYYFSDANQIRVFSLKQNAWLSSIQIPAPQGAYGPQRLIGIALSPDASKLAVADAGAIAVYLIDLNQPASIQSVAYASKMQADPTTETPTAVAVTNGGTVYVAASDLNGDGAPFLLQVIPATGTVNGLYFSSGLGDFPAEGGLVGISLASSQDGSRIYINDAGILGWVDTASGQVTIPYESDNYLGFGSYEVEVGANQTRVLADGFIADSNLNSIGLETLNVAESLDADYLYGAAFSADGNLLFQPGTQAIDVFDGVTGSFRARVALPMPLSGNFRALVSNHKDSTLVAITGKGDGIAVIDLNSLLEPNPVPWLTPYAAPVLQLHLTAPSVADLRSARTQVRKIRPHSTALMQRLLMKRK